MRIVAGILVFIALAIPLSAHLLVSVFLMPRLEMFRVKAERLAPRILQDLEKLSESPPFETAAAAANAETLLAGRVSWEGGKLPLPEVDQLHDLFARYTYWKSAPGQRKQMLADPVFKKLDAEWVGELYKFDHWSLTGNQDYARILRDAAAMNGLGRISALATLPLPNYKDLRLWATFYFLKKQKAGQARAGLHAFRRAAYLVHTSGTLVGNMVAVAMLKDEHLLVDLFKVDGWTVVPMDVIEAYQRVSWAWAGLAREPWFGPFPEKFRPYMDPRLGLCAAALEFTSGIPGFQDFFEPRFPFETSFGENIGRVRAYHAEVIKICGLGDYLELIGPTPAGANPWREYSRIPYLRRILGAILLTVAMPDYYGIYERKAQASAAEER